MGWKDKFAKKEFTERQQKYAALRRVRGLVTPQLMLGNNPVSGNADLVKKVDREADAKPDFSISVAPKIDGTKIVATITLKKLTPGATLTPTTQIIPLLVRNRATTKPTLGENKGAALVEHFTVLQAATPVLASTALNQVITVTFDRPESLDADNLNVSVLLEDSERLTTLECVSEAISGK